MASYPTETIKPTKKGQRPIKFKRGKLTAKANAAGKSISEYCASPSSKGGAAECRFKKNVLTGRKPKKRATRSRR